MPASLQQLRHLRAHKTWHPKRKHSACARTCTRVLAAPTRHHLVRAAGPWHAGTGPCSCLQAPAPARARARQAPGPARRSRRQHGQHGACDAPGAGRHRHSRQRTTNEPARVCTQQPPPQALGWRTHLAIRVTVSFLFPSPGLFCRCLKRKSLACCPLSSRGPCS